MSKNDSGRDKSVTLSLVPVDDFTPELSEADREHIHSLEEALVCSVRKYARVDLQYISDLTGVAVDEVIGQLVASGAILQNPETWRGDPLQGWELADEYLSGNLFRKALSVFTTNKEHNKRFRANAEALKRVMPEAIPFWDIYYGLGTPWIPEDIINRFVTEILFGFKDYQKPYAFACYDEVKNRWSVMYKSRYATKSKFGLKLYGVGALDILEDSLNLRMVQVFNTISDPKAKSGTRRVINEQVTALARKKQEEMEQAFVLWAKENELARKTIASNYNGRFGYVQHRHFNGSYLTFPGLSPEIILRPYQKNSVARILLTPNTLLSHDVGAGKTYVMIAAGMLLRQMGLSQKNLYVVPNSVVNQWQAFFAKLYPNAKVFVVSPESFQPDTRNSIMCRLRDEDHDAIVMAYSVFERIPLRVKPDWMKRQRTVAGDPKKPRQYPLPVKFEDLRVNTLFIDEIHNYKNISIHSKINNVFGLRLTGSDTCDDVMAKIYSVQDANNGRGVILATGTPITNSVSDLFIWQKMLQRGELKALDIDTFDNWIATFAERVAEYEIGADVKSLRLTTRFKNFHNLRGLSLQVSQIADFYTLDRDDDIPAYDGYKDHEVRMSEGQRLAFDIISERADLIHRQVVSPTEDNMLMLTVDGRKAALDVRLYDLAFTPEVENKVARCAREVSEIYRQGMSDKLSQLIFCDLSTPKSTFNIYDEVKAALIALGIPPEEIAFVHAFNTPKQRALLARKMDDGSIRVLIGSTYKLGTGMNVQKRLVAIHHLDVPWRPSDMIQREGRILRPGNTNAKIEIHRYFTEHSFDAYSWQLLETKQQLIFQLMSGFIRYRKIADLANTALSYGEIKALSVGDPLIKLRVQLVNEINRHVMLRQADVENRLALRIEREAIPDQIFALENELRRIKLDISLAARMPSVYTSREEKEEFGRLILEKAAKTEREAEYAPVSYRGFAIVFLERTADEKPTLIIRGNFDYVINFGSSGAGVVTRLDNRLGKLEEDIAARTDAIDQLQHRKIDINAILSVSESYTRKIEELQAKLEEVDILLQEKAKKKKKER